MLKLKMVPHSRIRWRERLGPPLTVISIGRWWKPYPIGCWSLLEVRASKNRNNAAEVFIIESGRVVTVWRAWDDVPAANDPKED